ncbi:MAG: urease accessory UreF family protein [Pseudomonadota bacterium]
MTGDPTLILAQMFSPSFPVGAFAYSHGMEVSFANRGLTDAASLRLWLTDVLEHGAGRADAELLVAEAQGQRAKPVARALSASAERLQETVQQGAALAATAAAIWGSDSAAAPYPVVCGRIAKHLNLPPKLAVTYYLHAFASNLVSAAVRAVPLGQTEGQHVLADLAPMISRISEEVTGNLEDISTCCFVSDINAMQHETLEPRIFRT